MFSSNPPSFGASTIAAVAAVAMSAIFSLSACGSDDGPSASSEAQEFCVELSRSWCDRFYSCFGPDQIADANLPVNVADCYREAELRLECNQVTEANACSAGLVFEPAAGDICTAEVGNAVCSQLANPNAIDDSCDVCVAPSDCSSPCNEADASSCGDGFACRRDATCGTRCVASSGTGKRLDACEDTDDCDNGHVCVGGNFCVRICDDANPCSNGGECSLDYGDTTVCTDNCKVGEDDSCPRNLTCRVSQTSSFCQAAGPRSEGQACEFFDCGEGLQCVGGQCLKLCEVGLGFECSFEETCASFGEPVFVENDEIGVCIPI